MAHVNHLKGQNVNLLLDLLGNGVLTPVAASTSCEFQVQGQSEDTQAKDDPGNGEWAAPSFTYYDWTAGNESYVVNVALLAQLLDKVVNGDATVPVQFQTPGRYANQCCYKGTAIITSFEITGAVDEKATVKISLDGASPLEQGSFVTIQPAAEIQEKISGKALMVAVKRNNAWETILCSTSHTLSVSVETEDVRDKDMNDKAVHKAVKSRSVSISSESFVPAEDSAALADTGVDFMMFAVRTGEICHLALGYYPDSIGHTVEEGSATKHSWGTPDTVLIEGDFRCTSLTPASGENQEDSKMSAEFSSVGMPTVVSPNAGE